MTTPADEIRAAAIKLRELAADATDGPWAAHDPNKQWHDPNKQWGDDRDHQLIGGGKALATFDTDHKGPLNTAYAATMHPGVGAAIADWLDQAADALTGIPVEANEPALVAARGINGETP